MAIRILAFLILGYACAAPAENNVLSKTEAAFQPERANSGTDLKTDASTYYDRYVDYGSRSYPSSGYAGGVTGYGTIDDRYNNFGGYDANGYGSSGYSDYDGYRSGYGSTGYNSPGYGNAGYGGAGYGNSGYASAGYGGYGGYSGNGGLNSYYGYNNPSYQGYGHLGYGYYNKRSGYGNIHNSGITPSLVTGYRGYSRK